MIDKKQAKKSGCGVLESESNLLDSRIAKIELIKSIIPSIVHEGNSLNIEALKNLFGPENIPEGRQGYGLYFPGKGLARIKANSPTTKELRIETKTSKNFDKTENVIIRGDNLDAIKILRQNYEGKIKMIYIDPPYNTETANFIYRDSFRDSEATLIKKYQLTEEQIKFFDNMLGTLNHSSWLFNMFPRLLLARELLTDDGIIFISIGEEEHANLKLLCNGIFGEENLISNIVIESPANKTGENIRIQNNTEYCLVYEKTYREGVVKKIKSDNSLRDLNDAPSPLTEKADTGYSIYYNPKTEDFMPVNDYDISKFETQSSEQFYQDKKSLTQKGYIPIRPGIKKGKLWRWRWDYNSFLERKDEIKFEKSKDSYMARFRTSGENAQKNLMKYGTGTQKLRELFEGKYVFDYPKSVEYIKKLIDLGTNLDSIILDFFAGSGTTAHAVMDLNKNDGGNRKFILVESNQKINPKDSDASESAYKYCKDNNLETVISSITIERVKRAGEVIEAENGILGKDFDSSYKVFSLTDKPKLIEHSKKGIELNINRLTELDTLYNMIAASGEHLLTDPIETIEDKLLYKIGEAYFVLGQCKTNLEDLAGHRIYIDGYSDISLADWMNITQADKDLVNILY